MSLLKTITYPYKRRLNQAQVLFIEKLNAIQSLIT